MLFLRVLGGLLLAALICGVAGVFKDYFHLWEAANLQYQWPIAMAASGAVGALVMALVKPTRQNVAAALPPPPVRMGRTPAGAGAGKAGAAGVSGEVPGMPTFDFDKARAAAGAGEGIEQSRPAVAPPSKEQG